MAAAVQLAPYVAGFPPSQALSVLSIEAALEIFEGKREKIVSKIFLQSTIELLRIKPDNLNVFIGDRSFRDTCLDPEFKLSEQPNESIVRFLKFLPIFNGPINSFALIRYLENQKVIAVKSLENCSARVENFVVDPFFSVGSLCAPYTVTRLLLGRAVEGKAVLHDFVIISLSRKIFLIQANNHSIPYISLHNAKSYQEISREDVLRIFNRVQYAWERLFSMNIEQSAELILYDVMSYEVNHP